MTIDVSVVTDCRDLAAEAAPLIATAFPVPFLEMNRPFLEWLLEARFDEGHPSVTAMAHSGGRLVAFVAAVPRLFALDDTTEVGYVVSFLSVAPDFQGGGLATVFYGRLLDQLAGLRAPVVNFTVDETISDRMTPALYARAGFTGHQLEPLIAWGALRNRLRPTIEGINTPMAHTLTVANTPAMQSHLNGDPRGSCELSAGARVTAAWRTTLGGREPVLILDLLPSPFDTASLAVAVAEGFAAFPEHGRHLTVPIIPPAAAALAESAGLRRLPGPAYHAWVWTTVPKHPFLGAERTAQPIL